MRRFVARAGLLGAGGLTTCIGLDFLSTDWSERHTWSTALKQYLLHAGMRIVGQWQRRQLLANAEDGEATQRRLLAEILAGHQSTVYGRDRGLLGVSTLEEFRRVHPVTSRGDYLEYTSRAQQGEKGVLTPGTAGALVARAVADARRQLLGLCSSFAVLADELPNAPLAGSLNLVLAPPSTGLFKYLLGTYTSPKAAYDMEQESVALYAHALFALKEAQLSVIETHSADLLCRLFDVVAANRRSLVQDLRNGHIWDRHLPEAAPTPNLREAIDAALGGPDAKRSAQLAPLLRDGAKGAELWPQLRVVVTADDGGAEPSAARLQQLLGEGVSIYSPFYVAAEELLGINLFPQRPFGRSAYLLDSGDIVFELLPQRWLGSEDPPRDAPVLPWQAGIGEVYEVLVTTRTGLCRCRLRDTVRVEAILGQIPVVTLQQRG